LSGWLHELLAVPHSAQAASNPETWGGPNGHGLQGSGRQDGKWRHRRSELERAIRSGRGTPKRRRQWKS